MLLSFSGRISSGGSRLDYTQKRAAIHKHPGHDLLQRLAREKYNGVKH